MGLQKGREASERGREEARERGSSRKGTNSRRRGRGELWEMGRSENATSEFDIRMRVEPVRSAHASALGLTGLIQRFLAQSVPTA
jgi:hypothetical protein